MDKNSITGFVLIGVIFFGFTWFQHKQDTKQREVQAQLDSAARVEQALRAAQDSAQKASGQAVMAEKPAASAKVQNIYKDAALDSAHNGEAQIYTLQNSKIELSFTSRGAQPYSARIKDYYNYDSTDLYIFKPGNAEYSVSVYTGEYINTKDFIFQLAESTDSSLVMRLPFSNGGYIEQKYILPADSYSLRNELAFVGMESIIPRNVSSYDLDIKMVIPRMEKGYKGEVQYSKVNYYFEGEGGPEDFAKGKSGSKTIDTKFSWFAFQQQFFSAIVRAPEQFSSGVLKADFFQKEDETHNLMSCEAKLRNELRPSDELRVPYEFYFGPNRYNILKSYGQKYEKIIPLGGSLVGWFTKYVIIPMFDFFHRFISNFGIIILLMTLVIKLVVLPFTFKSYVSSGKMQALKPEIERINERYPKQEDAMKKQQATMDLYKRAGVSPLGGCLPMLLTFPILWAMFRFFPASIELRQQSFLWCDDLSSYDSIISFGSSIPLIGDHISLFALLMAVTMWFYSKFAMNQQASGSDPSAKSMQFMSIWLMPVMMFFICNSLSAALSYYYLLSQLIAIIETLLIRKYFVNPEAVLAKVRASAGKPVQKSKWQLRLEEAARQAQKRK